MGKVNFGESKFEGCFDVEGRRGRYWGGIDGEGTDEWER